MTRHKHADVMIAYANDTSSKIQRKNWDGEWEDLSVNHNPSFYATYEYRIKPKEAVKGDFICEIDGVKWWLGPSSEKEMTWSDADEWCVDRGCILPPREVLLMCYLDENIRSQFKDEWHWSGSDHEDNLSIYAWAQGFSSGRQQLFPKRTTFYVRGVISSQ